MSEQFSSLDFQTDETNFDTERKWNNVSEETAKNVEISYTVSTGRLTKVGPMMWTVLRPLNKMHNEMLKDDKEDRDMSNTR